MRWAQLTLVENDPGQFDPQFWLDYFRRIQADAACLSAGGIVAYYPTEVPLHHRSDVARHRPIRSARSSTGCRALGMHVIARTDPHAARDEVRAAHPDWIAVEAGRPADRHWANPDLWVTCALGPYNFEFMDQVHREIVDEVPRRRHLRQPLGAAGRLLLRRTASENFKAATGLELPRSTDAAIRRAASSSSGARRG